MKIKFCKMYSENVKRRGKETEKNIISSQEDIKPNSRSAGWRVFIQIFVTLLLLPFIYVGYVLLFVEAPYELKELTMPDPPEWTGVLAENTELQRAEKLFLNQVHGPESIEFENGHMYTGVHDGKVVHIERGVIRTLATFGSQPCGGIENEPHCGRPLGMRFDKDGYLVILDAYKGLFRVNVATGDVYSYFTSDMPIEGEAPKFLNDLDIDKEGIIYFTDSSSKWYRKQLYNIFLEGENTGRLIKYDPAKNKTEVLVRGLHFPNGVQLSRSQDAVLVAETVKARIQKYFLKGPKAGQLEVFADNLPGLPDNIRLSTSGGFWVGIAKPRQAGRFDLIDYVLYETNFLRGFLAKAFYPETLLAYTQRIGRGLIVQLNSDGTIKRTLHDPTGQVIQSVSEIYDHNGILYIGSYKAPFIAKLDLTKKD